MNDATDLSLEADRLEELLEAPVAVAAGCHDRVSQPGGSLVVARSGPRAGARVGRAQSSTTSIRSLSDSARQGREGRVHPESSGRRAGRCDEICRTEPDTGVGSRGHCRPCGLAGRRPGRGRSERRRRPPAPAAEIRKGGQRRARHRCRGKPHDRGPTSRHGPGCVR